MRPILFYNNWCPFCRWAASIIARVDLMIAIIPFHDTKAWVFFEFYGIKGEERYKSWWIYTAPWWEGSLKAGNKGGWLALLSVMWRTRLLSKVVRKLRLSPLLDRMDNLISWARPFLAQFVPDVPTIRRHA